MNEILTFGTNIQSMRRSDDKRTKICIAVMLLCGLMVGILPRTFLGITVLLCSCFLMLTGEIYLSFPIMIFYYESFGVLFGMSVYRYFSLLFLFFIILTRRAVKIPQIHMLLFSIFTLYSLIVVGPDNLRKAIFAIVDIVCILVLINSFLKKEEFLKKFFSVYVLTALCAFVTGMIRQRTLVRLAMVDNEVIEIVRNYATFEDPNYASLFYTVAIFAMMSLALFRPALRGIFAAALSVMIITTLSITGLIVNLVLWPIYLFAFRKINFKTAFIILITIFLLLGLYFYGVENPQTPVLGPMTYRISDKLESLYEGDLKQVTTNRTSLTEYHWNYFKEQSFFRMLVGMNAASPLKSDLDGFKGIAHNEYVDLLLNIGIIGTVVFLTAILTRTATCFRRVRVNQDSYSGCIFMIKMIWFFYGLALTMFGDYRFFLLFFF